MAMLIEELIKSIEMWLKLIKKPQEYIDPTLDPVLLVPGVAGSILNAVDKKTGRTERVWVRILGADHEFCDKLWCRFDPSTGKTTNLDPDTSIEVPEDRYGLYAIDNLDPDMIIGSDCVYYYHDMIVEMLSWGYQEGKTLFGFGYDFRQSNRLQETMECFAQKLESIHTASGGKKINIISHSMGGLLVKCFMALHSDIFEKYVKNWIAIAAPFQGAPGYITSSLLNGTSFVHGWEERFFISKWSMHQLLIECPSIYELMGCPDFHWEHAPVLEIWKEKSNSNGESSVVLESYSPLEAVSVYELALANNKVTYNGEKISLPFNHGFIPEVPKPSSKGEGAVKPIKKKGEEGVKVDHSDGYIEKIDREKGGKGLYVGKKVRVVRGKEMGMKGEVLEVNSGGDLVILKLADKEVKLQARDLAELGSVEEERCLKKLLELKIREEKSNLDGVRKQSSGSRSRDEATTERKKESRRSQDERSDKVSWLASHIRVRIISKDLKRGRLYLKKGEIMDVVGPMSCDICMDETRELIQGVDQELLETALPKRGGPVLVLYGKNKGVYGHLVEKDSEKETGVIRDGDTKELLKVRLEQIAEYLGDPSYIGD